MTKQEIIYELYIKHNVWEAGCTEADLETKSKKYLEDWLKDLEGG